MNRLDNIIRKLADKTEVPDEYTIGELVDVYNEVVTSLERPGDVIKSFRDKPTAVRRVERVMIELRAQTAIDRQTAKETPGLQRLRAAPGAEDLRKTVLRDQEKALATAARDRAPPALSTDIPPPAPNGRRGRPSPFRPDQRIRILARTNPKRGAAGLRFAKYSDGMTVEEYQRAVGDPRMALRDLSWDSKQKWVEIV